MNFPESTCEAEILAETESVCPECLKKLPARRVARGGDVYLEKTCPEHGPVQVVIWRGEPAIGSWVRPKKPAYPKHPFTPVQQGCPYDCGLCPDHRAHTCCVLFEVTQGCDLGCPVCFASSGDQKVPDPPLDTLEKWFERLLEAGGPFNIQLSGGEPCLRDDLAQIIALGRKMGFTYFQLNTNGLRLASDETYLQSLVAAGLSAVFLQFDGTQDAIYQKLRGRPLLKQKITAIERCIEHNVGVVLVPTLVPGINTHNIGAMIDLALQYHPRVRGVHFQPISYFGRYIQEADSQTDNGGSPQENPNLQASQPQDRITIPEVIRAIEEQTQGRLRKDHFRPPGAENALCSFHGNFVRMPDGELRALTHHNPAPTCCCQPEDAAEGVIRLRTFVARSWSLPPDGQAIPVLDNSSLGEWDVLLERSKTHTFCLSGMAFQDVWNLDLERLRGCCVHTLSPDGKLVPFCAYNLTDRYGRTLYRNRALHA